MAGVSSTVRINDGMSPALKAINKALLLVIDNFDELQNVSGTSIDVSEIEDAREELNRTAHAVEEVSNEAEKVKKHLDDSTDSAHGLEGAIGKVAVAMGGLYALQKGVGFIRKCTDAFDEQLNVTNQLRTVLANMVGSDYENAYAKIKAKASEIQSKGMYGDEAMLGGAAELATYFKDSNAITMLMDTLTNYASGMSGGGEVGTQEMVNYATGLGKIMTGSYEAMTKKGFEFTDAQKAIIDGTATESQIVETLGQEYTKVSKDMQAAAAITQVINESWGGLYETMSNTPQGQIIAMKNAWGDIKEEIGAQLYPAILKLFEVLQSKMPEIGRFLSKAAGLLSGILEIVGSIAGFVADNFEPIIGIIGAITAATIAWKIAQIDLNAVLDACPLFLVLSLIGMVIGYIYKLIATTGSAEVAWLKFTDTFWTACEFMGESAIQLIQDVGNFFVNVLNGILDLISLIPGVELHIPEIDLYDKAHEENQKAQNERWKKISDKMNEIDEANRKANENDPLNEWLATFNNFKDDFTYVPDDVEGIAKSLDVTEEDLKYLRDIAEQEAINRFTTAEIKIDMQNNNNISSDMDIDGIVSTLEDRLYESMMIAAEGV